MKNLILAFLLVVANICASQNVKPDLANLPSTEEVELSLKGLSVEKVITQEQLIPLKKLELKGEHATKYTIVYYRFKTSYQHTFSQDEYFDDAITEPMTRFFTDLEKNCKLTYEDIVVKNTETGKSYKLSPLSVIVKVELKK